MWYFLLKYATAGSQCTVVVDYSAEGGRECSAKLTARLLLLSTLGQVRLIKWQMVFYIYKKYKRKGST
jgi:hypothetical protein